MLCGKQKAPDQRNRVAQVVGVRARDDAGGRAWLATERLQLTWVAQHGRGRPKQLVDQAIAREDSDQVRALVGRREHHDAAELGQLGLFERTTQHDRTEAMGYNVNLLDLLALGQISGSQVASDLFKRLAQTAIAPIADAKACAFEQLFDRTERSRAAPKPVE